MADSTDKDDNIGSEADKHHGQCRGVVRDDEHASDDCQQGSNREALEHENPHGLKRCDDKHREHEYDGQQREQPVRIHVPQSADLLDATHDPVHVDGMMMLNDGLLLPPQGPIIVGGPPA